MDFAPLRPVPLTPAGPVDLERAVEHVSSRVPGLDEPHARALALVAIAGRARSEVASELGIAEAELGRLLASARTSLRRSVRPLEGAGWCLQAEALLSDRLDGALTGGGTRRLDVHLRNCPRCAEHERRLIQAQNALVSAFGREPSETGRAELTLVREEVAAEQANAAELGGLVTVAAGALLLLASLLVIAAIVFALVAVLGL